ncbi:MAG TPA: glycosyltransferase, partial [Lachnospiraceae bacterium]|nr:glycosyltransferase [Lachnospiraceae bacterium]
DLFIDSGRPGALRYDQFFFPSGNILYKNHACIGKAVQLLREKGITDFEVVLTLTEEEAADVMELDKNDHNIVCRGRLSRNEVYRLYQERILLFPSYIETFGYPPAEARKAGTVIFASDCPFCHEVLENYEDAYYFDPFQPKELAALMEQSIKGELVRRAPAGRKFEYAVPACGKQSSWSTVCEQIAAAAKSDSTCAGMP